MSNELYWQSFIIKWKLLGIGQKIYISRLYHRDRRLTRMPSTTARPVQLSLKEFLRHLARSPWLMNFAL